MDRPLQLAKSVTETSGLAPEEVGGTAGSSGAVAGGTGRGGGTHGRSGLGGRRERPTRSERTSDGNNAAPPNHPPPWPAAHRATERRNASRSRERELAHLQKGLSHFLIAVIVGGAGVGKSALASALAQRWRGRKIYVRATDDDLDALVDEARQQLRGGAVEHRTTTEARLIDLAAQMNAGDVLVVIDDIHHLSGSARVALLAGLATALRSGRLLTTSREAIAPSGALFDYVELKLQSLDADAAKHLGSELDACYGPSPAFAAIWKQKNGLPISPSRARRGIGDVDPLDATIKGLSDDELTIAAFLALAQVPLNRDAIAALLPPPRGHTALRRLVTRMVVETDARERYSVCSKLGERVIQTLDPEQRRALAAALRNINLELSVRARESSRHLIRLGDLPRALQELLGAMESTSAPPADLSASFAAVAFTMARLDLAAQVAERAVRDADDLDARTRAVQILAMTRSCQGRPDDALRLLDELDLLISNPVEKASIACYRAICLFIAGRDRDASALMPHARALLDAPSPGHRAAAPSVVFAAVMARIGKFDAADRLLRQAERILDEDTDTLSIVELDLGKALVRWEKGDQIGAVDALQRVVETFEQYGHVLGAQTARVWLGAALMTIGRRSEGKRLLDEARASGIASLRAACDQAVAHDPVVQLEKDYDSPPRSKRGDWIRHSAVAALRAASHDRRHESLVLLAQLESATADGGFELDRAIAGLARAVMATLDCRSSEAATAMEAVRRLCAEANIDADLISAMLRVVGDLVLVSETSRKTLRAEQLDLSSFSIVIDARSHELRIRDRIVSLRKRTVLRRLLYALTRRLGRPVSKDDLTEALWSRPYNPLVHDNPLKSNIRHARHILAAAHIEIEFDEPGYRLVAPTGFAFVEPFLL